jgi:DNA-binding HxlR family transcriptional regulator
LSVVKRYEQYCPMAHALDLVGDRWALLVIRELMHGPKRYTDLVDHLPGIGTNILAARLRDLEGHGIVTRRTLPPPAASKVYELTDYGRELRPAMRELALWGARSLGPPTDEDELFEGWLANAMDNVLAPLAPPGRFEFRAGPEVAALVDGEVVAGAIDDPDVVVEGDPVGIYSLFVDRCLDQVTIHGDRALLDALLEVAPSRVEAPATT